MGTFRHIKLTDFAGKDWQTVRECIALINEYEDRRKSQNAYLQFKMERWKAPRGNFKNDVERNG